jgi:hypothetical protein
MTDRDAPGTALPEEDLRALARTWQAEIADVNARELAEFDEWSRERMKWTRFDLENPGKWRKYPDGYDPTGFGAFALSVWRWLRGRAAPKS